jgi:hypothetical protein
MKVATDIQKSDLIYFNLNLLPRLKSTYLTVLVIAIFTFIFICWKNGCPVSTRQWLGILIPSAIGGVFGMLFGTFFTIISILTKSSLNNGILGKHEFTLLDEGLYEKTSVNEGINSWEGISKMLVVGSYLLFQISGYLFHIIPKRSFSDEKQYREFISVARAHWEKAHNNAA